ncbi:MAG: hypothetical protein ACRDWB_04870, partial [Acidimicrobiales bacterium]
MKDEEHIADPLPTLAVTFTVKPLVGWPMSKVTLAFPFPSVEPAKEDVVVLYVAVTVTEAMGTVDLMMAVSLPPSG